MEWWDWLARCSKSDSDLLYIRGQGHRLGANPRSLIRGSAAAGNSDRPAERGGASRDRTDRLGLVRPLPANLLAPPKVPPRGGCLFLRGEPGSGPVVHPRPGRGSATRRSSLLCRSSSPPQCRHSPRYRLRVNSYCDKPPIILGGIIGGSRRRHDDNRHPTCYDGPARPQPFVSFHPVESGDRAPDCVRGTS